jgi:hypothetical protein
VFLFSVCENMVLQNPPTIYTHCNSAYFQILGVFEKLQYKRLVTSSCLPVRPFQTKVVEKIKTFILCSVTFLLNRAVLEIMWNNDNMAHAQCMLDT